MAKLKEVTRKYGTYEALCQVSLSFDEDDFVVLFGEDDAGKTSVLHILMGFDTEYEGEAELMGARPGEWKRSQLAQLRFVPDDIIYCRELSCKDYVNLSRQAAEAFDEELFAELCEAFELSLNGYVLGCTYQENKLLQILTAVCARPKLLILDEPKNFLNRETYQRILKLLDRMHGEGMGIFLSCENYEDAGGYARRYIYLKDGEVFKTGIVPEEDYRWKVITVTGGYSDKLRELLEGYLGEKQGRYCFSYHGSSGSLLNMLHACNCSDVVIDEMTFAEELEQDFSRWI